MKPRRVPRRLRCASITRVCAPLISGTSMGTSSTPRQAELLETTGVSSRANASSMARISALGISTAQKMKSAHSATRSRWALSITTISRTASGMGTGIFQLPSTAWA